jgi:pyruvate carboxylase
VRPSYSPISPTSPSTAIRKPRTGRSRRRCRCAGRAAYTNGDGIIDGTKQKLDALGPKKFGEWMRNEKRVLMTDTTMRDGHQSLLATRMRTYDIARIAGTYARPAEPVFARVLGRRDLRRLDALPDGRSVGAPVEVREAAPNLLLQMLLRGANGVGYKNYPDNVVKYFVRQAAQGGIDSSACSTA